MMTNLERYNFQDFTRDNYRRLLNLAKQKYVFRSYTNYDSDERFILWRHDIDISPQAARKLAAIEAEEGVIATYFLHLHSEFYNLFERSVSDCICDIIGLGHEVGLHFNTTYYGIDNEKQLDAFLKFELDIIERTFLQKLRVFSFHDPDTFVMKCLQHKYAGLINTYSDYFQTKVGYCSDSNGYWRFRRLEDVLLDGDEKQLQVLTHPCYWTDEVMSPRQRVWRCVDGRAKATRDWWSTHLSDNGREDIDLDYLSLSQIASMKYSSTGGGMLKSTHIALSPIGLDDLPDLYAWINDRDQVLMNKPYSPIHEGQHRDWFDAMHQRNDVIIFGIRLLKFAESSHDSVLGLGPLIGSCQLHSINYVHRAGELQIRIGDTSAQKMGYGTQATRLLLDFAFRDLNLHRVYLHVFANNKRAIRMYEKIGFVHEGVMRRMAYIDGVYIDAILMGILREEYQRV